MNIILWILAIIGLLAICFLVACLIAAGRVDKIIIGKRGEDEEDDW